MAIDQALLVARARELLTETDPAISVSYERLIAIIPTAISEWALVAAKNPAKLKNLIVETGNITITAGVADLTTTMETHGIPAEWIPKAEFVLVDGKDPKLNVRFVNSHNRLKLTGINDAYCNVAYFDGRKLYFGNTALAETFKMRVPVLPTSLANIPIAETGELAGILAALIRKFDYPRHEAKGVDFGLAKDGRK